MAAASPPSDVALRMEESIARKLKELKDFAEEEVYHDPDTGEVFDETTYFDLEIEFDAAKKEHDTSTLRELLNKVGKKLRPLKEEKEEKEKQKHDQEEMREKEKRDEEEMQARKKREEEEMQARKKREEEEHQREQNEKHEREKLEREEAAAERQFARDEKRRAQDMEEKQAERQFHLEELKRKSDATIMNALDQSVGGMRDSIVALSHKKDNPSRPRTIDMSPGTKKKLFCGPEDSPDKMIIETPKGTAKVPPPMTKMLSPLPNKKTEMPKDPIVEDTIAKEGMQGHACALFGGVDGEVEESPATVSVDVEVDGPKLEEERLFNFRKGDLVQTDDGTVATVVKVSADSAGRVMYAIKSKDDDNAPLLPKYPEQLSLQERPIDPWATMAAATATVAALEIPHGASDELRKLITMVRSAEGVKKHLLNSLTKTQPGEKKSLTGKGLFHDEITAWKETHTPAGAVYIDNDANRQLAQTLIEKFQALSVAGA